MMRSKYKKYSCSAILIAAALTARGQTPEKTFDVRFDRTFKVGQVFTVTTADAARASQKTETPDGQTMSASNFRRTVLEAEVRIEKVDTKNLPVLAAITLKRLTVQSVAAGQEQRESDPKEILPAGTAISATYLDGVPTFSLAGAKPIPPDALAALRREFHPTQLTDDVFGTPDKKKIGDTWPVDTKAMKADMTDPQAVDPRVFTGDVTLKAQRNVTGVNCLQFEAVLHSNTIPFLQVTPTEASITVTYATSLPVDPALPPVTNSMKTVTHIVVEQKPLGKGIVRTTSDSEVTHEATWFAK